MDRLHAMRATFGAEVLDGVPLAIVGRVDRQRVTAAGAANRRFNKPMGV